MLTTVKLHCVCLRLFVCILHHYSVCSLLVVYFSTSVLISFPQSLLFLQLAYDRERTAISVTSTPMQENRHPHTYRHDQSSPSSFLVCSYDTRPWTKRICILSWILDPPHTFVLFCFILQGTVHAHTLLFSYRLKAALHCQENLHFRLQDPFLDDAPLSPSCPAVSYTHLTLPTNHRV